jgi:hypothetical protein
MFVVATDVAAPGADSRQAAPHPEANVQKALAKGKDFDAAGW